MAAGEEIYYDYTGMTEGSKAPNSNRKIGKCPVCGEGGIITIRKNGDFETIHIETKATFEYEGKTYYARINRQNYCSGNHGPVAPRKAKTAAAV